MPSTILVNFFLLKSVFIVQIWLSYASFEAKIDQKDKFRGILQRAEDFFKGERNMKEVTFYFV